jgi:ubiquinone/menaquinone biosynthesis C-methylase UbiE
MDLSAYRASPAEQARIASLLALLPETFATGLDIGARDGYISRRMAEYSDHITALDLSVPDISHEKIVCVQGDATALKFATDTFDVVVCAEVLEHIPSPALERACQEIVRVSKHWVIIGVPFNQDTRLGATRCPGCGKTNPPWGHVNSFQVAKLTQLFAPLQVQKIDYVGTTRSRTNALSYTLMEYAGHPFGTYVQAEPCVFCDAAMHHIDRRTISQRLATRAAYMLTSVQQRFTPAQPTWVHILFEKA